MNYWLILGVMVATSATAQNSTNSLPAIPPPANTPVAAAPVLPVVEPAATNAPAAPKKKKVVHKKKAAAKPAAAKIPFTEATATLVPGPAEVCVSNLNVRGEAGLKGEVVSHLQKGDSVTVISQINLDKHKADEPAQWAKITLPASGGVWAHTSFIDEATKTVKPKKLNLRGGPGENYSVLGVLEHGATVTESITKGDWTKIEVPTNAYAFVAAMYLKQEASGNVPVNPAPSTETMPTPPPTPVNVAESQPINTTPTTPEAVPAPASNGNAMADGNVVPPPSLNGGAPVAPPVTPSVEDTNLPPPPPRVVTHEGFVRSSVSPVAPTYYELYDQSSGTAINYLFSTTTNLNLANYKGLQINVTGEEGLDARWKDTPVLSVQKIYVISGNAPTNTSTDTKKSKWHLW